MIKRLLFLMTFMVCLSLMASPFGVSEFRVGDDVHSPSEIMEEIDFPFIMSCAYDSPGLDVIFVIDTAYVTGDVIDNAIDVATDITDAAGDMDIKYGLVTYGDEVNVHDLDSSIPGRDLTSLGLIFLTAVEGLGNADVTDLPDIDLDAIYDAIYDYTFPETRPRIIVHFGDYEFCSSEYFPGNDTSCCCSRVTEHGDSELDSIFRVNDLFLFSLINEEIVETHADTTFRTLASYREGGVYIDADTLSRNLVDAIRMMGENGFEASLTLTNDSTETWDSLYMDAYNLSGLIPYTRSTVFTDIPADGEVTMSWPFASDTIDGEFEGCFRVDVTAVIVTITDDDTTVTRESTYYVGCATDDECHTYQTHATVVYPELEQITSNTRQIILFKLFDEVGDRISHESIKFIKNDTDTFQYGFDPVSYATVGYAEVDSSAFFMPGMALGGNGDTIKIELIVGDNNNGYGLAEPVSTRFILDTSGPVILSIDPPEDECSNLPYPTIDMEIFDSLSGINVDGLRISIGTRTYTPTHDNFTYEDGHIHVVSPIMFTEGSDVRVCILADDTPDLGGSTRLNYCWYMCFDNFGPYPYTIEPEDIQTSSCDDQTVRFVLGDTDGIDESSINFFVTRSGTPGDTTRLTTSSPGVLYSVVDDDGEIFYTPSTPFAEPDTITVCITGAMDPGGTEMAVTPYCWSFFMDQSPPVADNEYPPAETTLTDAVPSIYARIFDIASGFDNIRYSGSIAINGLVFEMESSMLSLNTDDSTLVFNTEESGFFFIGGDTVDVKFKVWDLVDLCSNNIDSLMWRFFVEGGGPVAEIVSPIRFDTLTCAYPVAAFHITDPTGVDTLSASIRINGRTMRWHHGGFSWDNSRNYLIFDWDTLWREGVNILELRDIDDLLGNPLATPLNYTFYLDNSPPVITGFGPTDDVSEPYPDIYWSCYDTLAGVGPEFVTITIGDYTFGPASEYITWNEDSTGMVFHTEAAGIFLPELDTVCVLLTVSDEPGGGLDISCPGNASDTTWCFTFESGGPSVALVYPWECAISSCDNDSVVFVVHDPNGLYPESVAVLAVREGPSISALDTFHFGDPEISVVDTFVIFNPSPAVTDGESLYVELVAATDWLLNPIVETEEIRAYYDLRIPVIEFRYPNPSGMVTDSFTLLSVQLSDNNGIRWESLVFSVNEYNFPFGDIALAINATTGMVTLNPEAAGLLWTEDDTFEICLSVNDIATGCGPNVLYTCWSFTVDYEGIDEELFLPDMIALSQNRPNPFNPVTEIDYQIPEATLVSLTVYDIQGNLVATLFEGQRDAGTYSATFDGTGLPTGPYFVRLATPEVVQTRRMILAK